MSKITGDEVISATFDKDGKVVEWGETLRQRALREFMCALISNNWYANNYNACATEADKLTTAYITQLNKPQSS